MAWHRSKKFIILSTSHSSFFVGLFRESRGERCIIVSCPKGVDLIRFFFHNVILLGFNCALAIVI